MTSNSAAHPRVDDQETNRSSNARLLDAIAVVASAAVAFGTLASPLGVTVMSIGACAGAATGLFVFFRKKTDTPEGSITTRS